MLDHQMRKDSTYDETAQVFGELSRLAPIIDATRFVTTAAILYSDEIGWAWNHAVSRMSGLLEKVDVSDQGRITRWYTALYREKAPADIIDPMRDLSGYKLCIVPNLYLIKPEMVTHLQAFVAQGGWLIVGPKTGLKNWQNAFLTDLPPGGGMADLFGVTVKRAPFRMGYGVPPKMTVAMEGDSPFAPGMRYNNEGMFDLLEPAHAKTIARFSSGESAVALNRFGDGLAVYVGCEPEEAFYRSLVQWLIAEGKVMVPLATDADVEVTLRAGGGHELIFVLNHNQAPEQIALEGSYREWITDTVVSGLIMVEGQGVRILERTES
ncbi:MAG: beta-galactosidase [Anaerolineae bacterium]